MSARGSYAKGVERREEILNVALDVFAQKGYRGTSLRDVAKIVGVSLAGVMHYFDSKEQLLTEILRRRDGRDTAEYEAGSDDIERLILIMHHNRDVPGLVQLHLTLAAAAEDPEHPAHAHFRDRIALLKTGLVAAIRDRQAAGTARADRDPELIARLLLAAADGIQVQWAVDRTVDMAADIDALWAMIADRSA